MKIYNIAEFWYYLSEKVGRSGCNAPPPPPPPPPPPSSTTFSAISKLSVVPDCHIQCQDNISVCIHPPSIANAATMPARAPISEEDIVDAAKLHDKLANADSVLKCRYLDLSGLGFLGMGTPLPLPHPPHTHKHTRHAAARRHPRAGVVGMLRNVRVLLLHTNHISRCDNIGSLVNLEVLNLAR
jgi:hypothetical protein